MQVAILALACLGAAAVSLVHADPVGPASEPTAATQQPTSVPSAPAAPDSLATSTAAAPDPDEQYALSHGYKPELRKGVKVFCRREDTLGSRVSPVKVCGRAKDLKQIAAQTQRDMDRTRVGQQNSQPDSTTHGTGK